MSGLLLAGDFYFNRLTADGQETSWEGPLNTTQLSVNTPSTRVNRQSKKKESYGQALSSIPIGQPTEITIALDDQPTSVLAMALQGEIATVNVASGAVVDEAVTLPANGGWAQLLNRNLAAEGLGAKQAADDAVIPIAQIEVNFALGLIRGKPGTAMAAGGAIKFSYQHNAISGRKIRGGIRSEARLKIKGDMKNLDTGNMMHFEVFECSVSPSAAVDLMASEFVSTTLAGVVKLVEGQTEPFSLTEIDTV